MDQILILSYGSQLNTYTYEFKTAVLFIYVFRITIFLILSDYICSVMVRMFVSSVLDHTFQSCPVKQNTMVFIFAASPLSTARRSKSKDWLAWNQDNVSE